MDELLDRIGSHLRRSCLSRNHGIEPGRELTAAEQDYVVDVICRWIERELAL